MAAAQRARLGIGGRSTPMGRFLATAVVGVVTLAALLVAIPLALMVLLAGLVVGAGVWLWLTVKVALLRAKQPNGALDQRRNVRVRMPGPDEA